MAGIEYTSIEEVVNDFQLLIDDTSYDKEAQTHQLRLLALQGLRELKFDAEQEVKTSTQVVLDSSSSSNHLSIELPSDYVKMLRIGYKGADGNFHPFSSNPNLSLDASVSAQVSDDSLNENNPYYHTDLGKKYGQGGGNNDLGYYRINRNDQRINFSSNLAGKTVFMEYISDGIEQERTKDYVIRLKFKGAAATGSDNGPVFGTKVKIPHVLDNQYIEYTFVNSTSETINNHQIALPPKNPAAETDSDNSLFMKGTASEIAKVFASAVNEGYPERGIGPRSPYIKAFCDEDKGTVTLTYSTLGSDLLPVASTKLNSNTETYYIPGDAGYESILKDRWPLAERIELVQQAEPGEGSHIGPSIHRFCEEALRCYIYYKFIQRKRGIPANEKQMAKRAYYNEKRLARARMMSFSKETAMQTSRKAFKQSPKF
jgi:hypothetical protein